MKWLGSVLVVFATFTAASYTASAMSQDDAERENLTDIREVNVIVEELAADAEGGWPDARCIGNRHRAAATASRRSTWKLTAGG